MITAPQWVLIIGGILLATSGGIFLKLGAELLPHDQPIDYIFWAAATNYKIVLGFLLYLGPSLIWIYLLKTMELSLLQPLFSLTYVFTPLFAFLVLGESVPLHRCLGIFIIVVGVYVSARG